MGALIELIFSILFDILFEFRITRWLMGLAIMAAIAWWGDLYGLTFWVIELGILEAGNGFGYRLNFGADLP